MTNRKKITLLAIPGLLAAVAASAAAVHAQVPSSAAHTGSVHKVVMAAPAEPTDSPEAGSTTDPAGTKDTGGGHTDEAPGSNVESNVDHQFDGQE
jgi:hypothetical protein